MVRDSQSHGHRVVSTFPKLLSLSLVMSAVGGRRSPALDRD